MTVEHLEVFVEEPSMEEALRHLLPKMVVDLSFEIYQCQCKDELLTRLPERLRGYATWLPSNWRILVMIDRDDDNCGALKSRLEMMAREAKLSTRTEARGREYHVLNRVVIEELEAWYFGDWSAVRAAYGRVSATIPKREKYRDPDAITGGTWEAFQRIMRTAGYFAGGLRKIEIARRIAPLMEVERNTSRSFQVLREALKEMTGS